MDEISGGEFLLYVAGYMALVLGGLLFRHHFEKRWWVCGYSVDDDLFSRLMGTVLAFLVGGFFFYGVLSVLRYGDGAPLDGRVWWTLVLPGLWHGINFLVAGLKYVRYKKDRDRKLGHWLEETPPQSKDELTEYIKLTLDFPELAVEEGWWRDGDAVWSLSSQTIQSTPKLTLRDERVTIYLLFLVFPGHERFGNVVLRVSEWRQFPERILVGIHEEWVRAQGRAREEIHRKRQEAELEVIRVEQDRREAEQRERETIAALLEGRPRQGAIAPATVAVVQEEIAEAAVPPVAVATEHRQPQQQTRIQDLEGLGREL